MAGIKPFRVFRWKATRVFMLACLSSPVVALEAADIAKAFGLDISPLITEQQRATLSPEFSDQFRNHADLTPSALTQYLADHPLELEALRSYLQDLVDRGMMDPELALSVLEQGIRTFSMRPIHTAP